MIDKEDILEKTNRGLDVFKHFLDFSFKPGKNFKNPLYKDKNASCNIYYDKRSQSFRMKDFGNAEYSGDCFWFVASLKGLDVKKDFVNVISIIVKEMNLGISSNVQKENNVDYLKKELSVLNESTLYTMNTKSFSKAELSYWNRYGITESILNAYHVTSVAEFRSVNQNKDNYCIVSQDTDPIFAYNGNGYVKLYRPYNRKRRFLYGGIMPDIYCFGMELLPNKGDMVFITGGEKDVMSLYAKGFHAICFNSETAVIPNVVIEMLERKFRHIIMLYDMDETGIRESLRQCSLLSEYNIMRLQLPLLGTPQEKDISDYFASGKNASDFRVLITELLEKLYSQTMMLLKSCEMDYNNPPQMSKIVVSVNDVPLGTYDNLLCITGGEGTGKSNFVSAIIAGALVDANRGIDTLGLEVCPNYNRKGILHYDTEQSEYQLYKNMQKTMKRVEADRLPEEYHSFYLASMSRKERLQIIRESMDLYYHKHNGIHLVVIDGIADLIRSANDEMESIAVVDELYRLAGIYRTCIVCVLHFVPNGIKLRGHIGSELQRKAAAIISIEKDEDSIHSMVKAIKVRDGSPLDVPILLFSWDKEKEMHLFVGEKSVEDKEKRKRQDLIRIAKEIFRGKSKFSYTELTKILIDTLYIKDRTAKNYIKYMKDYGIVIQDRNSDYILGNKE